MGTLATHLLLALPTLMVRTPCGREARMCPQRLLSPLKEGPG
jgi:hypothetical protein